MKRDKKNFLLSAILAVLLVFSTPIFAQNSDGQLFEDGTQDLIIVVASGAFGAVLGLSTLSFVEKPEEHLKSIVVGGAIGIIIGVATVAVIQANKSQQMYLGEASDLSSQNFSTYARNEWNSSFQTGGVVPTQSVAYLQHSFTF